MNNPFAETNIQTAIKHFQPNKNKLQNEIANNAVSSHAIIWQEPVPFTSQLLPVETFSIKLLPNSLRDWLVDICQRMDNAPIDFAAVSALCALGSLLGRKVSICPKQHDNWQVIPNLWCAIIGRPSSKKTPLLNEIIKPIKDFERTASEDYKAALEDHQIDQELQQLQKKQNQKAAEKHLSRDEPHDAKALLQKGLENIEEPTRRRHLVNDSTVPKLGEILADNPMGVMLFRDELVGWLKSLDRDDRGEDRAFFLECWNGMGGFTFDRISRGTIEIKHAVLSIIGGIQPSKFIPYLQSQKKGQGDDGLIERFQLMVYPDKPAFTYVDRHPNNDAKTKAHAVFQKLNEIAEPTEIPTLRFSQEAQVVFNDWYQSLHKRLDQEDISPQLESHLAKYPSLMPSLALILHCCDHSIEKPVGIEAAIQAVAWCHYLESHAKRIYGLVDDNEQSAKALLKKLPNLVSPFSSTDFIKKGWAGLSTSDEVQKALDELVRRHYLQNQTIKSSGRDKTLYHIHPAI